MSLAQTRLSERREEKIKEMKSKYERQLRDMKRELKQLELSRKEHSKAMKKNVNLNRFNLLALTWLLSRHNKRESCDR